MTGKIVNLKDGVAITIPAELLNELGLSEGDEVSVTFDRARRLIIASPSSAPSAEIDEEFARQVAEFVDEYRPALEALAK